MLRLLLPLSMTLACADAVGDPDDVVSSDTEVGLDGPDSDVAPAPERPAVVVNELMASNESALVVDGATPDWLELHNATTVEVSLAGWTIEDAQSGPIALGDLRVPAGGFLVLYADDGGVTGSAGQGGPAARSADEEGDSDDDDPTDDDGPAPHEERGRHLPFKLSRVADRVVLTDVAGRADSLAFEVLQAEDFSFARVPDGCDLPECLRRVHLGTPGATNGAAP